MCGYMTYQDPRLQPDFEPEPDEGVDAYERCIHSSVCRYWCKVDDVPLEERVVVLGCVDCSYWEGD